MLSCNSRFYLIFLMALLAIYFAYSLPAFADSYEKSLFGYDDKSIYSPGVSFKAAPKIIGGSPDTGEVAIDEENPFGFEYKAISFSDEGTGGIQKIIWSPDQTRLVATRGVLYNKIYMYDLTSSRVLWEENADADLFDPTGKYLISASNMPPELDPSKLSQDSWVKLGIDEWSRLNALRMDKLSQTIFSLIPADTGEPIRYINDPTIDDPQHLDPQRRVLFKTFGGKLALSRSGDILAAATHNGVTALYDTKTWSLRKHIGPIPMPLDGSPVFIDPERNILISHSVWKLDTGIKISDRIPYQMWQSPSLAYDPSTGTMFTANRDNGITLRECADNPECLAITKKELEENQTRIRAWNAETGQLLATYEETALGVVSLTLSPDGEYLIANIGSGLIKIWDTKTGKLIKQFNLAATGFAFSPDGKSIAYATGNIVHIVSVKF